MHVVSIIMAAAFVTLTAAASAGLREVAHHRTFFYVGGGYQPLTNGQHIYKNQMYVEKLVPSRNYRGQPRSQPHPIVLIHGQAQTGTNFLNKPDGTTSWTSRFLSEGYTVYIVDQTFRGRSAWAPGAGAPTPSTYSAELIQDRFTATQDHDLWPQARLHTQWPGPGVMGDLVFDAFYSSNVEFIGNATYQQSTVQAAGASLLDIIDEPVILLGHSQGSLMPLLIADVRRNLTAGIILLEPTGPPFQEAVFGFGSTRRWGLTDVPLSYDPPVADPSRDLVQQVYPPPNPNSNNSTIPCILQAQSPTPRQLPNLSPKPILVVTGEASYHAPYDYCTAEFLKQAGCSKTTHLELGKAGIRGNGHMLFMEKNSNQIWDRMHSWIRQEVL